MEIIYAFEKSEWKIHFRNGWYNKFKKTSFEKHVVFGLNI